MKILENPKTELLFCPRCSIKLKFIEETLFIENQIITKWHCNHYSTTITIYDVFLRK